MIKNVKRIMAWVLAVIISLTPILPQIPAMNVIAAEQASLLDDSMTVTKGSTDEAYFEDGSYTINGQGDVFAISDVKKEYFCYETAVTMNEMRGAVSIIFGVKEKEKEAPTQYSIVANINVESGEARLFRFKNGGASDLTSSVTKEEWKNQSQYVLKVEVVGGQVLYYINDVIALSAACPDYQEGYLGIMGWNSNITYTGATVSQLTGITSDNTGEGKTFDTNLSNWNADRGIWQITDNGLQGKGFGNSAIYSKQKGSNFTFEADMTVDSGNTGGSIIFRADEGHSVYYAADIAYWDNAGKKARIIKYYKEDGEIKETVIGEEHILTNQATDTFDLKVEAVGSHIEFYVNDELAVDVTDDAYSNGYFGLNVCDITATFNNVNYQENEVSDPATLTGFTLSDGLQADQSFNKNVLDYTVDVSYDIDSIKITPEMENNGIIKINGAEVSQGTESEAIALEYGTNLIKIQAVTDGNGYNRTTTLHILRNYDPNEVYDLAYRPQYHYSLQANWLNDPNGMVYFEGEYHLFYQHYPEDSVHGPMHWGHAVSTDLIHWKELPIAMYPDGNGNIFSGSAVVDENNTTGFFDGIEGGGLVAIFTHDNPSKGQQYQSLAYSKDKGRTWTKYEGNPVIPYSQDPLQDTAFRDPKVFWNEEDSLWMMVIAGGPLRLFSSPDLKSWKAEGAYKDLHTECPDLFPLKVEGTDETKWVLNGGGRFYMIGDFKKVNGTWEFIPESERITLNFAPDSYAAQTYSNTPDGRCIMINWMNNWAYCNDVKNVTGVSNFNGFLSLQHELKLKKNEAGEVRLYQEVIDEYQTLRDEDNKIVIDNKTVLPDGDNLLRDFSGNLYEIIAEFTPTAGTTEVGFKLRTGKGEETLVSYDLKKNTLTVDRSVSGLNPNEENFAGIYSQKTSRTADGNIKIHIFVDESSVEVFGNDGETAGAAAIFPKFSSLGAEVYVKGGQAKLNMTLYPMNSIWDTMRRSTASEPTSVLLDCQNENATMQLGGTLTVASKVLPVKADQAVSWEVDGDNISIVEEDDKTISIKADALGEADLTVTTANGKTKTITIEVAPAEQINEAGFISNIETWKKVGGDWTMSEAGYTGTRDDNGFVMAKGTSDDFTYEADVTYHSGQAIGLIFRSSSYIPNGYVVNIDGIHGGGTARFFTYGGGSGDVGNSVPLDFALTSGTKYHLKLDVEGNHFKFYINGKLYLDVTDEIDNYPTGQFVGLYVFKSSATYQNVMVTSKTTGGNNSGGSQSTTEGATTETGTTEETVEKTLTGWNKVNEQLSNAKAGTKITASDIPDSKIPSKVLKSIKGKNITLQIPGKNYTWSINGKNITGTVKSTTDVSLKRTKLTKVQTAGVKQFVAKSKQVTQFQIPGTSNFGFKGSLSLSVGTSYVGKTLYLSVYNTKTKRLDVKGTAKVNKNGTITYSVSGPGNYIITSEKPSSLQLAETKTVTKGKSTYLKVANVSKNAKITYHTSEKSVATVNKNGKITGIKKGKAVITTKVKQGNKTYTFKTVITVK